MAGHTMAEGMSMPTESFAGAAPANAAELAAAHMPYDATMPPVPSGKVANVQLTLKNMTVQIAPGVKYNTWAFDGHGAPGPVIHVRQGQTVDMTLKNGGTIPHSIDFHAARIAPNKAFKDVMPGESFSFRFTANDPGVFMYHCGTKPVLAHIANGMYGAIVVDPAKPLPKADHEYVLVASEWYLNTDGITAPASLDMGKARAMTPDWMTFNGYASQYATHPLTAKPGETTRFYVVAAGPTMDTNFHVVGTLLNRAWGNADMTSYQRNVQTVAVPAGGGGVFDVKIDAPGLYPFVSHAFAHVDLGQVGVLKVGNVPGTMSH
jgi:nitrite reductase (NO-forming)